MDTPTEEPATSTGTCCKTAVKVPLFVLNLITLICGGGLLGLGIWVVSTDNKYKHFAENRNIFIVYISLAAVTFTAGIFGTCGILAGNKILLKMYFSTVCIVFCALFGVVIFGLVQKNVVKELVRDNWNKTSDETRIFIQEKFKCCGIEDDVNYSHDSNLHASCFENAKPPEARQNCLSKLIDWFEENQLIISLCGASVMLFMVLLMVSSCYLLRQLGTSNREMKRSRVAPAVIIENGGNTMNSFNTQTARSNDRDLEMVAVEEPSREHYPQEKRCHERGPQRQPTSKRQSWAKNNTIF